MSKLQTAFYNIIALISFNFLYWNWSPYQKHIIDFSGSDFSLSSIAVNAVYFFLFFFFLSVFASRGKALFSSGIFEYGVPVWKKLCLDRIAVLFAVQIVVDLIYFKCSTITGVYIGFFNNALSLLNWLLIYKILTFKRIESSLNKTSKTLVFSSIVLVLVVFFFINYSTAAELCLLLQKYNLSDLAAAEKISSIQNLSFINTLTGLIFDTLIGSIVIIMFVINCGTEDNKNKKFLSVRGILSILIYVYILFVGSKVLTLLKIYVYPDGFMKGFNVLRSESSSDHYDDRFDFDSTKFEISRYVCSDQGYIKKPQYISEKVKLYNSNSKTKTKIKTAEIQMKDYNFSENDDGEYFKEYSINGTTVYLYRNCAICFVENGTPKTIEFEELKNTENNQTVTEFLKTLIEEGNIMAFEYGSEYLMKYDKNFTAHYPELSTY